MVNILIYDFVENMYHIVLINIKEDAHETTYLHGIL